MHKAVITRQRPLCAPHLKSLLLTAGRWAWKGALAWQTFLALATSWQMIVFLYLAAAAQGALADEHSGGQHTALAELRLRSAPGIVARTPPEHGVGPARDVALCAVVDALHAHVRVGAEARLAHDGEVRALPAILLLVAHHAVRHTGRAQRASPLSAVLLAHSPL